MMFVLMLYDWFECQDCTDEYTSNTLMYYAWRLTDKQWFRVREILE